MVMDQSSTLRLGLIGDNIAVSQSPKLHRIAGEIAGLQVTYDRLVPADLGMGFNQVLRHARDIGLRGVNVTYPYKEQVAGLVTVSDLLVRSIGSVNTVLFEPDGSLGFNTDYSGFMSAYRAARGDIGPGKVCLIGTGGVGKAVAFGLIALGADEICCVDLDPARAEALARTLRSMNSETRIKTSDHVEAAAKGADGLVNCTPLGMVGIGGTPLPMPAMQGAVWAFDAVYTPVETQFLREASQMVETVISGYELFLGQGVDAWRLFSGCPVGKTALRRRLAEENP